MIKFHHGHQKYMSEINIIPFTDIVLVILVVFIVSTPILIQSAIKVKLPAVETAKKNEKPNMADTIRISITDKGLIYISDHQVPSLMDLDALLGTLLTKKKIVIIDADQNANYGLVAKVLGVAQKNGAEKLELSTKHDGKNTPQ